MVEEDLLHLKMELVAALKSRHLHLVMLEAEEVGLEDKEVEVEENKFDAPNVMEQDINPMTVQKMVVPIIEMLLLLQLKKKNIRFQKQKTYQS